MQESTRKKLEEFTKMSTWHTNHPSDDERFFDFIIESYRNDDYVDREVFFDAFSDDLTQELEEKVKDLHDFYERGRYLLKRYNKEG